MNSFILFTGDILCLAFGGLLIALFFIERKARAKNTGMPADTQQQMYAQAKPVRKDGAIMLVAIAVASVGLVSFIGHLGFMSGQYCVPWDQFMSSIPHRRFHSYH